MWIAMLDTCMGAHVCGPPNAPGSMLQGRWEVYAREARIGNRWRNRKSNQHKCLIAFLRVKAYMFKVLM